MRAGRQPTRTLAAALAAVLVAAGDAVGQPPNETARPGMAVGEAEEGAEDEQPSAAMRALTGREHASVIPAYTPRRFAPGQSGELALVIALRGDAVLPVATRFEVLYESAQGPVQLGTWQRRPPRARARPPGTVAPPRYDDVIRVDIPVQLDGDAEPGVLHVRVRIGTALHHADTGAPLADFVQDVVCPLEVGAPLPMPLPVRGPGEEAPPAPAPEAPPETVPAGDAGPAAVVSAANGFALVVADHARLPVGGSVEIPVRLQIPTGMHALHDAELETPALRVEHAGDLEWRVVAPEPPPAGVVHDEWAASVVLRCALDAELGERETRLVVRYAPCEGAACFPPAELGTPLVLHVVSESGVAADEGLSREGASVAPSTDAAPVPPIVWWLLLVVVGFGGLAWWRARGVRSA